VGNDVLKTAQSLMTIGCKNGTPDWRNIDKLVEQWQPDLLLLGLPLNMDGTESNFSRQTVQFGNELEGRYSLVVKYEDERLSSNEADKLLRDSLGAKQGLSKKLRSKRDQIAARLILESYFARHA
jgi:putative Holliday junction resolvase